MEKVTNYDISRSVSTILTRKSWIMYHGSALMFRPKLSLLLSPSLRRIYKNRNQQTSSWLLLGETLHKPHWKPIKLTCLTSTMANPKNSLRYWETGKSQLTEPAWLHLQYQLLIYVRCYVEKVLDNLVNYQQPYQAHHRGFTWVIYPHEYTFQA